MAKVDLDYLIVEAGIGGPPTGNPVLIDKDGKIIAPDDLIIFDKNDHKDMRKVDHFRLKFTIKDFENSPLRFPSNMANAMWAQKGTTAASCPTTACEMPGVFYADKLHQQGKSLEVINMDMQVEKFWFSLNLVPKTDPNSTNYVQVDPGGDNKNGGLPGSGFQSNYSAAIAAGLAAGLVAFFGATLLLDG